MGGLGVPGVSAVKGVRDKETYIPMRTFGVSAQRQADKMNGRTAECNLRIGERLDSGRIDMRTPRLLLRRWRESDQEPFAAVNSDPDVMEHFAASMTRRESDAFIEAIEAGFTQRGYGFWALEVIATGEFIGFTGLWVPSFEAHFTPAVEVGWRLGRSFWGHGYATEAARAALEFGFDSLKLEEIVAFTPMTNWRSERVMHRVGMTHDPGDDFDHPQFPEGHRLRRFLLYRVSASRWRALRVPRVAVDRHDQHGGDM
jgi:RimJ/RimL family protein N-acetyltransferase